MIVKGGAVVVVLSCTTMVFCGTQPAMKMNGPFFDLWPMSKFVHYAKDHDLFFNAK